MALGKDFDPGPVEQTGALRIILNVVRDLAKK
jgi:hypothetical protein